MLHFLQRDLLCPQLAPSGADPLQRCLGLAAPLGIVLAMLARSVFVGLDERNAQICIASSLLGPAQIALLAGNRAQVRRESALYRDRSCQCRLWRSLGVRLLGALGKHDLLAGAWAVVGANGVRAGVAASDRNQLAALPLDAAQARLVGAPLAGALWRDELEPRGPARRN